MICGFFQGNCLVSAHREAEDCDRVVALTGFQFSTGEVGMIRRVREMLKLALVPLQKDNEVIASGVADGSDLVRGIARYAGVDQEPRIFGFCDLGPRAWHWIECGGIQCLWMAAITVFTGAARF
jgi:hypothetical protein